MPDVVHIYEWKNTLELFWAIRPTTSGMRLRIEKYCLTKAACRHKCHLTLRFFYKYHSVCNFSESHDKSHDISHVSKREVSAPMSGSWKTAYMYCKARGKQLASFNARENYWSWTCSLNWQNLSAERAFFTRLYRPDVVSTPLDSSLVALYFVRNVHC